MAGDGREEALYDLYDCGRYDGRYSTSELMGMLGIRHRQQIEHYSDIGILYQKRYRIVRADADPVTTWGDEWDRVCDRLRDSGYDLGRIRIVRTGIGGRGFRWTRLENGI